MEMQIIKYPKIYRLPTLNITAKKTLTSKEVKELFDGEVIIEEKIDGSIIGLANTHAQGRGREIRLGENSKQFKFFNSWRSQNQFKIDKIPDNTIIYGEWMYAKHNVFYDKLPDFFIAFDVFDNGKFLDYKRKIKLINDIGFSNSKLLFEGVWNKTTEKLIDKLIGTSHFSTDEIMEGFVIKNYKKQLFGKYVRREFMDDLDEHWLRKPLVVNKLEGWKK